MRHQRENWGIPVDCNGGHFIIVSPPARRRVYLDHAATSWPRLPGVLEAMVDFERNHGAAIGRGGTSAAASAGALASSVRSMLARCIAASGADEIALMANGTAANNYALAGVLRAGDRVVTTAAEHNSVLRPLELLRRQRDIEVVQLPVDRVGRVEPEDVAKAVEKPTRLVAVCSASNVTGALQPLEMIGQIARNADAVFFVDAAQSMGYRPLDVQQLQIDLLAAPGHKGAGGPLGTGFLYCRRGLHPHWQPLWIGGTGSHSERIDLPDDEVQWQMTAESGNLNSTAIAGWHCGLKQLLAGASGENLSLLRASLVEVLAESGLGQILGLSSHGDYAPVVSLNCARSGLSAADWSGILDASFGIETRAGLHCAAGIHSYLGTAAVGGTLRFSLGHTSTAGDIEQLTDAFSQLRADGMLTDISASTGVR